MTGSAPASADLRVFAKKELKRPSEFADDIPAEFEEVLLKGMELDSSNRYASMKELQEAFREAEKAGAGEGKRSGGSKGAGRSGKIENSRDSRDYRSSDDSRGSTNANKDASTDGRTNSAGSGARKPQPEKKEKKGGYGKIVGVIAAAAAVACLGGVLLLGNAGRDNKDAKKEAVESAVEGSMEEEAKTKDEATPTPEPTATYTPTPEPTSTLTPTPKPTATNTPTPKPTATNTPTPKPTATNTPTPKPTATNTPTPKPLRKTPVHDGGKKVGISMPTRDLQRWNRDGANMEAELTDAGYEVELQFAYNNPYTQLNQIKTMIDNGCDILVIAAIEGDSLGEALGMAAEYEIPVIAYDRLLMDSDAVSYYVTFDNYMVGYVQGNYIVNALDLEYADGPFNLEITAGDPGDHYAGFFYLGAIDVLQPYIDEGKLVIPSGQIAFEEVATPQWMTDTAQSRAENILSNYYADGTNVDAWLCSNDSTALGVEIALAASYSGEYPIVTGQDCDIENTKNIIAGKQSMSVFKDTRILISQVVKMIGQIINNEEVDVNDTETYDNGVIVVPAYVCEPIYVDAYNYKELLIDSGYYTEDLLQ